MLFIRAQPKPSPLAGIKKDTTNGYMGTAIFSDDFAADIRNEFKDKIAFGKSPSLLKGFTKNGFKYKARY